MTSTKDVLDGLWESRLRFTFEIERPSFKKQNSRSVPFLSARKLFHAGFLALQSMPKKARFLTPDGIKSKIDSRCKGIDARDGLQ